MRYANTILIAILLYPYSVGADELPPKSTTTAEMKPDYDENFLSLKDLTGVYVVLDYVTGASEKSHLTVNANLQKNIQNRLESAGLKLLTKEEMLLTPGKPELDIYPNYPAHLSTAMPVADSVPTAIDANTTNTNNCCYTSIWGSFSQGAHLERNSVGQYRLGTWGNGSNTDTCEKLGEWMSDATLKIIDNFIVDFKKAQDTKVAAKLQQVTATVLATQPTEKTPKQLVSIKNTGDTKNVACGTAFVVYAEVFKTGSAIISTTKSSVFDELTTHMLSCNKHRYRIETHSDQRASHESNEILSARRAITIHNYLVKKGISEDQFEMRFFGDRKPISKGTTEEDYATNRRVVIEPID